MKRLTIMIVTLGILILTGSSLALSSSLVSDIERSMKKFERKLCSELPSPKCRRAQRKPAPKAVHVTKPVHKSAPKIEQQIVPGAVADDKKPLENVPAEVTPEMKPEIASVPASRIQPVPPMPRARPNNLKVGGAIALDPAKPSANLPRTHVTVPAFAPTQSPSATAGSKPAAGFAPIPPAAVVMPPVTPPKPPAAHPAPLPPAVTSPVAPAIAVPPIQAPPMAGDNGCLAALSASGTSFAPVAQPSSSASCQVQTPVRLFSIASKAGPVKLPDHPTVNCAFALKLSTWVDTRAQSLAQQEAGSSIIAMGTGPGFDCRGRNGDSSAKMSEHAIGDAVDIVYIKLANKAQILVKDALNTQSPHFAFLRDVRAAACLNFNTVLGPGTNAAHAEHFHIDLEHRRGDYRMCE